MEDINHVQMEREARNMVDGTELNWREVIRYAGTLDGRFRYEIAVGIIQNKPLWKGSTYYYRGKKCTATASLTKGYYAHCAWEPPVVNDGWIKVPPLSVVKPKPKYTKIRKWGNAYYVREELLLSLTEALLDRSSALTMMRFSDFVVERDTDKVLKYRNIYIEDVFDGYTGVEENG